jgi:hypothetical protein
MFGVLLFIWVWFVGAAAAEEPPIEHVILVSVDGLRSDALTTLGRSKLPNFFRLLDDAGTLDARCDPTLALTLPNHTSMVTGRLVAGTAGHGWTSNTTPPSGATLHQNSAGYLHSVFDVAHDHGIVTGLFAGKEKFILLDRSYDATHGRPDRVDKENNGRDKVDVYMRTSDSTQLTKGLLHQLLDGGPRTLGFVHYGEPDGAGHSAGWDLTPDSAYLRSILEVEEQLKIILRILDNNEEKKSRTAIVLTADHGGGVPFRSHVDPGAAVNHTIPFLVWRGGHGQKKDLYQLNPGRRERVKGNPLKPTVPPIRNGEMGNVGLQLLGLPAIEGSTLNASQDLTVR